MEQPKASKLTSLEQLPKCLLFYSQERQLLTQMPNENVYIFLVRDTNVQVASQVLSRRADLFSFIKPTITLRMNSSKITSWLKIWPHKYYENVLTHFEVVRSFNYRFKTIIFPPSLTICFFSVIDLPSRSIQEKQAFVEMFIIFSVGSYWKFKFSKLDCWSKYDLTISSILNVM